MTARQVAILAACITIGVAFSAFIVGPRRPTEPRLATGLPARAIVEPFASDQTALADCVGQVGAERQACVDQAFGNVAVSAGAAPALDQLEAAADTGALGPVNCHRVAHAIGAAAISRANGVVAIALADGAPTCASGYYHGVVERALAGVAPRDVTRAATGLCDGTEGEVGGQCLHGLGHGLMLRTAYDLPAALAVCESLGGAPRDQCSSGAFMENHSASYGTVSPWLRDDDLTWPCPAPEVQGAARDVCWTTVAARAATALNYELDEVADVCGDAPKARWRRVCIRNLGELAAEQAGYGASRTIAACTVVGAQLLGACLQGAATITYARFGDERRARELCEAAPATTRDACNSGIRGQTVPAHVEGGA